MIQLRPFLWSCIFTLVVCQTQAQPPSDAPATGIQTEQQPRPANIDMTKLDRYQMLTIENQILLLDKANGDTWQLVTEKTTEPYWKAILRRQPTAKPPSNDQPNSDVRTAPSVSKKTASGKKVVDPEPEKRTSLFNGPAVKGPVDVQLIKGLEIVVVRGPKESVQAVRKAVEDIDRAWNGTKRKP